MTPLAAYLLLFLAVGTGFIFVHLLAGKLIRPNRPHKEKGTIYECGEPTIGSAWVQFDLRFYVVALLFVILIFGHIYIGTLGMEGAFDAMGSGKVDLNWAREHHSVWVEELRRSDQVPLAEPAHSAGDD